ncbi:hypothetical protein [Faecalitalea cylindroides]|nr:hypothetical protein [Faecalitalea cylindroides]MEE1448570.1 hypothetical protein [Faecalitalea cylindroides]
MKFLEVILVILGVLLVLAYFGILIIVLSNIVYWPITWFFELYGGVL